MKNSDTNHNAHKVFKALADPTRLRILSILRESEHCVSDFTAILQVPQAKASHHLVYLHRVGLVEIRHQGLWSFYRLSPARTQFRRKLLECLRHCTGSIPGQDSDRHLAVQLRRSGSCCPGLARRPERSAPRPS